VFIRKREKVISQPKLHISSVLDRKNFMTYFPELAPSSQLYYGSYFMMFGSKYSCGIVLRYYYY